VRRQVHNLINSPPISGAWKEGRDLSVHGVMFRIETGLLEVTALTMILTLLRTLTPTPNQDINLDPGCALPINKLAR